MLQTILSIAGKPGLYKLVSRGKSNLIVEALDETHKRQPAFATDRISSLADIAMYTDAEDIALADVLARCVTRRPESPVHSTGARPAQLNCRPTLLRCCPTSTATACTTATSRNCCNGMTFW